jgi:hypothetical protein
MDHRCVNDLRPLVKEALVIIGSECLGWSGVRQEKMTDLRSGQANVLGALGDAYRGALLCDSGWGGVASCPCVRAVRTISALPRAEKRFIGARRVWSSAVWRSGSRGAMRLA